MLKWIGLLQQQKSIFHEFWAVVKANCIIATVFNILRILGSFSVDGGERQEICLCSRRRQRRTWGSSTNLESFSMFTSFQNEQSQLQTLNVRYECQKSKMQFFIGLWFCAISSAVFWTHCLLFFGSNSWYVMNLMRDPLVNFWDSLGTLVLYDFYRKFRTFFYLLGKLEWI